MYTALSINAFGPISDNLGGIFEMYIGITNSNKMGMFRTV